MPGSTCQFAGINRDVSAEYHQLSRRITGRAFEHYTHQRLRNNATGAQVCEVLRIAKAAHLFREAVALNPTHEDSRYYLASCLYAQGDTTGALEQLEVLIRPNPQSQRSYQRKGLLLAASSNSTAQLNAAEECVSKALALNPEETGALLLLGEIALLKRDRNMAAQRMELDNFNSVLQGKSSRNYQNPGSSA